jgi:hypothetical protein
VSEITWEGGKHIHAVSCWGYNSLFIAAREKYEREREREREDNQIRYVKKDTFIFEMAFST